MISMAVITSAPTVEAGCLLWSENEKGTLAAPSAAAIRTSDTFGSLDGLEPRRSKFFLLLLLLAPLFMPFLLFPLLLFDDEEEAEQSRSCFEIELAAGRGSGSSTGAVKGSKVHSTMRQVSRRPPGRISRMES